ncbi:putative pumilio homolog 8, chloroplastic [Zingiber officinale]|uniref:PUM-HD domain-containing protein n=1 Tax=Zingiber officinale TaxID=94328 RepID=A0A8J5HP14_ZINOF|nr:putative pumilio homolog 8, chloroplastic [Zingiber officinale]KAG6532863.1 hypothetical protein ZIOFF_006721 [Zingiber officinale]
MENDQRTSSSSSGADPVSRIHRGGDALPSSLPYVPQPAADWQLWGEDSLIEQMTTMNIGGARGNSSVIGDRRPEQRLTRATSAPEPAPLISPQWSSSSSSSSLGNPHRGELFEPFPLGNGGASIDRRGPPFDFPGPPQSADRSRVLGFSNPPNAVAAAADFTLNPRSLSLGHDPLWRLGRGKQIRTSHALHLCNQELLLSTIIPMNPNSEAARRCIYCTAKDRQGCQILLQMITAGNSRIVHVIFGGVINHVPELMRNPVAHQLLQTLLDVCTEEHRLNFLLTLSADRRQLFKVSLHPHGTRVVQKLIETVKTVAQIQLVITAFESVFLELAKDSNGNRVIHSLLTCLPPAYKEFIFSATARHCVLMAMHQHGCCLLQRCLEHSGGAHRVNITMQIVDHAFSLALDPFGNYAIQYVLKKRSPIVNSRLVSQFSGYYITLSTQKFSSNVVEKCLECFEEEGQAGIVQELLSVPRFEELLQDQYANYVIKAALNHTQGYLRAELEAAILPHIALRNHPHCKRIFSIVLGKH